MVVQVGLCRKGFVMVRSSEASGWLSRATTRFTTLAARLFIPLRFILSDISELADVRLRHGNLVLPYLSLKSLHSLFGSSLQSLHKLLKWLCHVGKRFPNELQHRPTEGLLYAERGATVRLWG